MASSDREGREWLVAEKELLAVCSVFTLTQNLTQQEAVLPLDGAEDSISPAALAAPILRRPEQVRRCG